MEDVYLKYLQELNHDDDGFTTIIVPNHTTEKKKVVQRKQSTNHSTQKVDLTKPVWVQDLRNAWEEEIQEHMTSEKRLYFKQFETDDEEDEESNKKRSRKSQEARVLTSSSKLKRARSLDDTSQNNRGFSKGNKTRTTKRTNFFEKIFFATSFITRPTTKLRDELEKYLVKLNGFLKESELVIEELKNNEINLSKSIAQEHLNLKKCALYNVLPKFRMLTAIKLLRIKLRLELELGCKEKIEDRINLAQKALKMTELPPYVKSDFFKEVDELLICHPDLMSKWATIKKIDRIANRWREEYVQMRKQANPRTTRENGALVKTILSKLELPYQKDKPFIDSLENSLQLEFEIILSDERTTEGKQIKNFLKEMNSFGFEKVPPSEILGYISSFVEYLSKMYKIPKGTETACLNQCVHRFFYSLIGPQLHEIEIKANREKTDKFIKKALMLEKLTPEELGVLPQFVPSTLFTLQKPFYECIDVLGYLEILLTPIDMLHCIYCCATMIHQIAKETCEQRGYKFSFAADEFLPILVYCVIHANIPHIHAIASFLEKFGGNLLNSEMQYYLTSLESAALYITELTPKQIDELKKAHSQKSDSSKQTVNRRRHRQSIVQFVSELKKNNEGEQNGATISSHPLSPQD